MSRATKHLIALSIAYSCYACGGEAGKEHLSIREYSLQFSAMDRYVQFDPGSLGPEKRDGMRVRRFRESSPLDLELAFQHVPSTYKRTQHLRQLWASGVKKTPTDAEVARELGLPTVTLGTLDSGKPFSVCVRALDNTPQDDVLALLGPENWEMGMLEGQPTGRPIRIPLRYKRQVFRNTRLPIGDFVIQVRLALLLEDNAGEKRLLEASSAPFLLRIQEDHADASLYYHWFAYLKAQLRDSPENQEWCQEQVRAILDDADRNKIDLSSLAVARACYRIGLFDRAYEAFSVHYRDYTPPTKGHGGTLSSLYWPLFKKLCEDLGKPLQPPPNGALQ